MFLCGFELEKVDPEKGEYVVVADFGSEGIKIRAQVATIEEAVQEMSRPYGGEPMAVFKLVWVDIKERKE